MKERGRFITLEGGEGAGKSTQARILADWLRTLGLEVRVTREPGGSPRAEVLRELLLSGAVARFGAEAEALFFAVARSDHLTELIRPALRAGAWVISDRFLDSTRAYQGSSGVPAETLDRLDALAVGDNRPDLTIILDLPPEIGLRRIQKRRRSMDRFEGDPLALHRARRQVFLEIAALEPGRCVVVDSSQEKFAVAAVIRAAVEERLTPGQPEGA